jgi:hypothetical protein
MAGELQYRGFFDNYIDASTPQALQALGKSIGTLLVTPSHSETIHISMKSMKLAKPLPTQPPIPNVQNAINEILPKIDKERIRTLNRHQLIYLASALIQFTDHVPLLRPYVKTSYSHVGSLHDEIVGQAANSGRPLSFPEQFEISLEQNSGDLQNSLWQLFITSRFFARRRDAAAIDGLPQSDGTEKMRSMIEWQHSLAACVPYEPGSYQDAAGDTYYSWTHALAKVTFDGLPTHPSHSTNLTNYIFEHGTNIMQAYVNRVYPEGGGATARDHLTAAAYGNAIGKVCVNAIKHDN